MWIVDFWLLIVACCCVLFGPCMWLCDCIVVLPLGGVIVRVVLVRCFVVSALRVRLLLFVLLSLLWFACLSPFCCCHNSVPYGRRCSCSCPFLFRRHVEVAVFACYVGCGSCCLRLWFTCRACFGG